MLFSKKIVDGVEVDTVKAQFNSANILGLEVGTTGRCNGDAGHGGRTYFAIKNIAGTCMDATLNMDKFGHQVEEVVIELEGDTELETFLQALKTAVETLEFMVNVKENM